MKYLVILSYDGSSYNGYQKQKHDKNTIQQKVEDALSTIFKTKIEIYASGRTDKGVHAIAQPFHFESDIKIPFSNLKKALNEILPLDIKIKKVSKAKDDFHARYSKIKKIYVYKIKNSDIIDPFDSRYVTYVKEKIDYDLLLEASKLFIGEHDFRNFTTNKASEVDSFVKKIFDVKVKRSTNRYEITFEGSGFLRYQIRMMVGAIIVVATGKKDISFIKNMLSPNVDSRCSYKADPQGLYLKEVVY